MKRITAAILLLCLPFFALSQEPKAKGQAVTADEARAIQNAFIDEQAARLQLEKAQQTRLAIIYRVYAEHALKPSEYDLLPDGKGGMVFVKKQAEKEAGKP